MLTYKKTTDSANGLTPLLETPRQEPSRAESEVDWLESEACRVLFTSEDDKAKIKALERKSSMLRNKLDVALEKGVKASNKCR